MIKLRELNVHDSEYMLEWMKDPDVNKYFKHDFESETIESVKKFIDGSKIDMENGLNYNYAIVNLYDEYLGTVSLKNVDRYSLNAELAISIRKKSQGVGIGELSIRKILNIAFENLNLEKVYLSVRSDNLRAIYLYEKVGFKLEGEFRNHIRVNEKYISLKWYGLLKSEI